MRDFLFVQVIYHFESEIPGKKMVFVSIIFYANSEDTIPYYGARFGTSKEWLTDEEGKRSSFSISLYQTFSARRGTEFFHQESIFRSAEKALEVVQ